MIYLYVSGNCWAGGKAVLKGSVAQLQLTQVQNNTLTSKHHILYILHSFDLYRFKTLPWPQNILFYIIAFQLFLLQFALGQDSSEPNWLLPNVSSASFFTTFRPDYDIVLFFQTNIKKMKCSYSKRKDKLATVVKAVVSRVFVKRN